MLQKRGKDACNLKFLPIFKISSTRTKSQQQLVINKTVYETMLIISQPIK